MTRSAAPPTKTAERSQQRHDCGASQQRRRLAGSSRKLPVGIAMIASLATGVAPLDTARSTGLRKPTAG